MAWTGTPKSSNLEKFAYDHETFALMVVFKGSQACYRYNGVPHSIYDGLMNILKSGGSVGQYFIHEIRNDFKATRISAGAEMSPNDSTGIVAETVKAMAGFKWVSVNSPMACFF